MKTIILFTICAALTGCVSNIEKPQRETAVVAPRESAYRDLGYSKDEARNAARRDDWQASKDARPVLIPAGYFSSKFVLMENDPQPRTSADAMPGESFSIHAPAAIAGSIALQTNPIAR